MRIFRNILLTLIIMAAIGAGTLFGYYRYRGSKEMQLMNEGIALMEQGNYRAARGKFADAQQFENRSPDIFPPIRWRRICTGTPPFVISGWGSTRRLLLSMIN